MRFIPTRVHGVLDYVVGLVLLLLPFVLGLQRGGFWALLALGALGIVYSLVTDYELGVVRYLCIRFHLVLDALMGIALLVMPWLSDIPGDSRWPMITIGILALILSFTTHTQADGTAAA